MTGVTVMSRYPTVTLALCCLLVSCLPSAQPPAGRSVLPAAGTRPGAAQLLIINITLLDV